MGSTLPAGSTVEEKSPVRCAAVGMVCSEARKMCSRTPSNDKAKKGTLGVLDQVWNQHRAGYVETELVAPQGRDRFTVLLHFVRYGIQHVVAEILIDASVPEHLPPLLLRPRRAVRPHALIARQNLEFVRGAGEGGRLRRDGLALLRAQGRQRDAGQSKT